MKVSGCGDLLDCGGSGRGENQSGMTESHTQALEKMLVPTARAEVEGRGWLEDQYKTAGKTHSCHEVPDQSGSQQKKGSPGMAPLQILKEGRTFRAVGRLKGTDLG